ncbi:T9SS type A sorting domain-containing protein [uncultured Winogradskyella sp.]|uniref:T9SS type A sorting domain-containing protein n=1 Tax=uncultured Winogradskyella sp. TaxID=395353 RepID=UPI00260D52E5|nr:T9SS type A sorting domain-containing protein [uncultured Winogradskyella sp.]
MQNLDATAYGRQIISGDIDGDNDNDLLSVYLNNTDIRIEWFENTNSSGNFASKEILINLEDIEAVNAYAYNDIILTDIDDDDRLDILFNNSLNKKVSWYKNLGSAIFGTEQVIVESVYYSDKYLYAADINNDNNIDVVTSSSDESQISWHKNLAGLGDFGGQNSVSSFVYGINNFVKADLDHDGDFDLISSSEFDGKIAWYKNVNGLGEFTDKQIIINNTLNVVREVFSKDIDLDGDMDIIALGHLHIFYEPSRITVYLNDGNANFSEQIILDDDGRLDHLIVEDIDGDYDADLIGIIDDNNLYRKINNGDGTFGDTEVIVNNMASNPLDVKLEDIDNDGDKDIFISHSNGDFSIYTNSDGQGTYTLGQVISGEASNPYLLYIVDINNDGLKDILYRDNNSEIAYMLAIDNQGTFGSKVVAVSSSANFIRGLYAIDMDNDRDLDIVSSTYFGSNDNQVVWFENFGNLNFGPAIEIASNIGVLKHVDALDIDDNGSLDLIMATGDFQLMWLENLGLSSNEINGTLLLDLDNDGCNEGDAPFSNHLVIADNGVNQYGTFTGFNGIYQLFIEEPGIFDTTVTHQFQDLLTVGPTSVSLDLNDLNTSITQDFCVEANGIINDLEVAVFPTSEEARPGFETSYRIIYTNSGAQIESGIIRFEFTDALLNFVSASEPVFNTTFGEIQFQYFNLDPFETRFIDINMIVEPPPIAVGGDELTIFSFIAGVSENDATPSNNSHGFKQFLVNSYDPNDITVLEGEEIFIDDADEYLHYLIRFQNTGTASAININVEHQLDDKLDWQTMRLQSLSHNGRAEIINGSMINFIFDDIHLPDSTSNEPDSHGYIAYKIKPKSNVVIGDIFSGVADIYFDFNPPIITNTVNTEIIETLDVNEFDKEEVRIYPNPAKNKLEVSSNRIIDRLTITDINGRQLNSVQLSVTDYNLDVSNLSKGIYFLEIRSGKLKSTKKFIKN